MKPIILTTGDKFHKLTFIKVLGKTDIGTNSGAFRCDCGKETVARIAEVRSGHTKSCGCSTWKERSQKSSSDIVGKKYGRLTVLSLCERPDNRKYRLCNCKCECGNTLKIRIARMLSGELQSCGCLQLEKAMENIAKAQRACVTHGLSDTLTGRSWQAMMQRCYNPWSENFFRYGGRGISACLFIRSTPINLLYLIGERPSAEMSLDRIDNEGGYWCGLCAECLTAGRKINVRWVTASEQCLNKCNNRLVEIDGVIKKGAEWCKLLGLPKTSKKIYGNYGHQES